MTSHADNTSLRPSRQVAAIGNLSAHLDARQIQTRILVLTLICGLPPSVLLATGRVSFAGLYFWSVLGLLLLHLTLRGDRIVLLSLVVAVSPLINLLRSVAPAYSIVIILLFGSLVVYDFYSGPSEKVMQVLRRCPLAIGAIIYLVIYYILSFLFVGSYDANMRIFELVFSFIIMLMIGRNRETLGSALLGMGGSALAIGLAMVPYISSTKDQRLGLIVVEGQALGNPISLGIPLALFFLALVVDRGRWLNLERAPTWRVPLMLVTFVLLALTSSRGAWLAAAVGIFTAILFSSRSRFKILLAILVAAVAFEILLLSPLGEPFQRGLDRTFNAEGSIGHRTSGRSDQWVLAYEVFTRSARSMLIGYGPGMGPEVYATYSQDIQKVEFAVGLKMALHSLYMQVGVEAGLLGLIPLLSWLLVALFTVFKWCNRHGVIFPLLCLLVFIMNGVGVSGFDTVSGTCVGVGLLATMRRTGNRKHGGRTRGTSMDRDFVNSRRNIERL